MISAHSIEIPPEFPDELSAARYLLCDATKTLLECNVNFVVVGGWVPLLFHASRFGHPGTYDLDVLLNTVSIDNGSFNAAGEMLLARGYLRAVKNTFQAHRILNVAGENFVFHVDFLNERHTEDPLQLVGGTGRLKSIYTPAMQAVFDYNNYRTLPGLPGLSFPSVETFIATKAAAVAVKKRRRDAFDVFVSVKDQEPSSFRLKWAALVRQDDLFRRANDALYEAVTNGDAITKIQSILEELRQEKAAEDDIPNEDEIRAAFDFVLEAESR